MDVARGLPRVGFVSLGCPKALVDSEGILSRLRAEGYDISDSFDGADLVIVNTCGFIEPAVEESLGAIEEALAENGNVIVTGCLGTKAHDLRQRFPRLLAVTGPHAPDDVIQAVHRVLPPAHDPFESLLPPGGIKLTPRHYAYIKIAEGCNHRCTFCIIPSLRGRLVSRPIADVLREAEALVSAGVKELLVVSQDTSAYGVDLRHRTDLAGTRALRNHIVDLTQHLGSLGIWVRLHYVYPYPHVDDLVRLMGEGRVLPYLDMPLQHASPRILKLMKRPANQLATIKRIQRWREECPELTLRSTFVVGFPGETEEEFQELLEFAREVMLDRVGCFAYSPVAGAVANALPDAVPEPVREERRLRFMQAQEEISAGRLSRRVGTEVEVLIDSVSATEATGRSAGESPEIDGVVRLTNPGALQMGDWARVRITDSDSHDLAAQVI